MADRIRWDIIANAGKGWLDSYQQGRETYFDNRAREVLNPSGPSLLQQLVGGVVPGVQQPGGGSILSQLAGIPEAPQQAPQRFDPNNPTPEQLSVLMQSRQYAPFATQLMQQRQQQANADRQFNFGVKQANQQQQNWERTFNRGETPQGFEPDPENPGTLRPRRGGPADPNYIKLVTEAKPQRQVPFGIQNAEKEDLEGVQSINTINSELNRFSDQIANGELKLGFMNNIIAQSRNFAGKSDESSRNYQSFLAALERLRNESLRLNKGVQTEGDAVRAWNELVANINDPKVVQQRLKELISVNQRAADFKKNVIVQRREDNRLPALNFDRVLTPQPSAPNVQQQSGNLPRINSRQEMMRLPPGSKFIWTDGTEWTVPPR